MLALPYICRLDGGTRPVKSRLSLHLSSLHLPSHWFRRGSPAEASESAFQATVSASTEVVPPVSGALAQPASAAEVLQVSLRLHEELAALSDLGAALSLVRRSMCDAMQARASVLLRSLRTRDGSVVLQAVDAGEWSAGLADGGCLDLGACATVVAGGLNRDGAKDLSDPLVRALQLDRAQTGWAGASSAPGWPWRSAGAGPSVALPLTAAGGAEEGREVIGVIEWHGVVGDATPWLPLLDSLGRTLSLGMAGLNRGRRSAEPDLALLNVLTQTLPVSLVVLEPGEFRVCMLNHHAEVELGVQREAVIGQPFDALLGERVQAALVPNWRVVMGREGPLEHVMRWASADGERQVSMRHVAVRDGQGRVRWLICQWRDVTGTRLTEQSLAASQTRFKDLVESIEEGVFVSDPDRLRLDYASARMLEILGLSAEGAAATASLLTQRVVADDRPLLADVAARERALQGSDVRLRIEHPVHGLRWLRQRTQARRLPDGGVQVVGLVDDVTDEHERSRQLQCAREAAEAASQAKSQFMATMTHEIRTPMNGILGMTELLLGTRLGEKQRRFAQAVYRSAENLLEIVNDVLDVAKIEAGRLELAPAEVSLHGVVEDVLELLAPRAHDKGLELSFEAAPGAPDRVLADPLRLRQVLTNLVANAVKFTEHGEVHVDLACAPWPGEPQAVELTFAVRDTGVGIAEQDVPRLFQAFTQGEAGLARRYGGTGLGLAITRQLVELMGGRITVSSEVGCGSLFRFTMRAGVVSAPASASPVQLASPDMPRLRVLLVEDHSTTRQVLAMQLCDWGLDVTATADGHAALQLLRSSRYGDDQFQLALVDWRMPGLDGIAWARTVMDERLQPGMKLALLSSMSAPEELRAARMAGYRWFIQKPVRKAELREVLLNMSGQEAQDAPAPQLGLDVLVVEDNLVNQEVMLHMLIQLGCRVRVASSGIEGLARLAAAHHDVVLMDIRMPDMDGIQVLQTLRRGPPPDQRWATVPEVPVIAVTANASEDDERLLMGQGFDGYLSKPYRQSDLLKVMLACQGEAWQSEFAPLDDGLIAVAEGAPVEQPVAGPKPQIGDRLPILDPGILARRHGLEGAGQNLFFERVCSAFERSLQRLSAQLDNSIAARDAHGVGMVVHTLKSSASNVGAIRLAQISESLDDHLRAGTELAALGDALHQLQQQIRLAQQDLASRQACALPS